MEFELYCCCLINEESGAFLNPSITCHSLCRPDFTFVSELRACVHDACAVATLGIADERRAHAVSANIFFSCDEYIYSCNLHPEMGIKISSGAFVISSL